MHKLQRIKTMKTSQFQFGAESKALFTAILSLKTEKECEKFFRDLCTLSELKSMTERWVIVKNLELEKSYREISEITGASTTTVTRVAHWLENGDGGYRLVLNRTGKIH